MPRSIKLSWQPGIHGRQGRWRKKYKGRRYYFAGGRGKSDSDAYDAALAAWEKQKVRIDATAPKAHQADYEQAIADWELVLAWCHKHREAEMADTALTKLDALRKGLSALKPAPVAPEDTFAGRFDRSVRYPGLDEVLNKVAPPAATAAETASQFARLPGYEQYLAAVSRFANGVADPRDGHGRTVVVPSPALGESTDTLTLEREVWNDRLEVMQRSAAPVEKTIGHLVAKFLTEKKDAVAVGDLSIGRPEKLRSQLTHFQDWLGSGVSVTEITSDTLMDYRAELLTNLRNEAESAPPATKGRPPTTKGRLNKAGARQWTRSTVKDRLSAVTSFVRWLWESEAIATLPRVLAKTSKRLHVGTSEARVIVFTKEEVGSLLKSASLRTRLYLLLMLNTGMGQKDVSDLEFGQVDWDLGRITRKRSKTRKHENVPTVTHLLWPETLALLRQEQSAIGRGRVLLNSSGEPLWLESVGVDGQQKKNDNIRNAFERLRTKLGIDKSLRSLRKTSASLIRGHRDYRGLEDLFLGHAPRKISDRHYTVPPEELLGQATNWLRQEYGIEDCCSTTESIRPRKQQNPRHNKAQATKTAARATRRPPR
ncbi:MAG: tyrosine-type recombinase/integrase [Planctomycetes bacterium]|nr:tyrosine-type recombinase/integrase [Planctomycetota bacterium]